MTVHKSIVTTEQFIADVAEVHNFYQNFTITASGEVDETLSVTAESSSTETYFLVVGVGFAWTPDTSGDKFYPSALIPTLGASARVMGLAEGSGTLTIYAKTVSPFYYTGQTNQTP